MESIGHTHTHSGRNFHSYGTTGLLRHQKQFFGPSFPPPPWGVAPERATVAPTPGRDGHQMIPPPSAGGFGTRPWWLALLACGGACWPLTLEPSAMTSRHPHCCGHPHCHGHPPAWVGIWNATSAHGVLP